MGILPRLPRLNLNLSQKLTYSPYGPRPHRSPRLIKAWIAALAIVVLIMYYMMTRHRDTTRSYANMLAHGHGQAGGGDGGGAAVRGGGGGAAGEGVGTAAVAMGD
ncbi:hypothetical protein UCREL1_7162 [Eutypa lata UCREL1]|uniref:Uncharacterized protein n=1 Tax=Eutypa lata (strain UCR-EL1) TaxID=1287681 RepID=M7SHR5_EUTLA|nr:hypothetical protein UCREL1_7162 [Eutypa lata UCREL1]